MGGKRKTRGRPAKAAVEGERNPLGLRVTADLKRKIEEGAAASGRSQSQEAEFHLERAYLDINARIEEFGGADNYRIAKLLFAVVPIIEADSGHSWREHGPTFNQVASAWGTILEVLRRQASKSSGGLFGVGDASIGREKAIEVMQERIEDLVRQPKTISKSNAIARALIKVAPVPEKKK